MVYTDETWEDSEFELTSMAMTRWYLRTDLLSWIDILSSANLSVRAEQNRLFEALNAIPHAAPFDQHRRFALGHYFSESNPDHFSLMNSIRSHLTQPNRQVEYGRMQTAATDIHRSSNDQALAFQRNVERLRAILCNAPLLVTRRSFEQRHKLRWSTRVEPRHSSTSDDNPAGPPPRELSVRAEALTSGGGSAESATEGETDIATHSGVRAAISSNNFRH